MRVVSVATAAMWPQVRVMARSLRRCHPTWTVAVAVVGRPPVRQADDELVTAVSIEELLGLDPGDLLAAYGLDALVNMLVPRVLLAGLGAVGGPVMHMPATAWIRARLDPLTAPLSGGSVLLLPRAATDPPNDGLEPSPRQLALAGRIAPDVMAVDGSDEARAFLSWWIERLDAIIGSPERRTRGHLAEDRHWVYRSLELAPSLFPGVRLGDPACQLTIWNLHEHTIEETGAGLLVDRTSPLRLIDLRGFGPDQPHILSPLSTRVRLSAEPVLRSICARYSEALLDAGWVPGRRRADIGRRLANGIVFDDALERIYAEAQMLGEDFGDIFSPQGTAAFMAWLTGPASRGAASGVNRYVLSRVVKERTDVTEAFPDLDARDGPAFVAWCTTHGRREMGFPAELLPSTTSVPDLASTDGGAVDPVVAASANSGAAAAQGPAATSVDGAHLGVRVTGFMGHVLGLGSAARAYAQALASAGVPLTTVSVALDHVNAPRLVSGDYGRESYADVLAEGGHTFELVCVNPDELSDYMHRLGRDYLRGRRIGVWGWEVNTIPDRWNHAFSLVDEVWVYSRFVSENIGAVSPIPVVALPPPVKAPAPAPPLRLGVPAGFLFLFVFDYLSTVQRKNPVGLIEAFKRAFAPGEGPQLLIKTINAPLRPLQDEALRWAVEGRPDIHVVDRSLTAEQKDGLIAGCDCYVSLHRSEGFGLTLAEAMAVGKPVIGTGYSGNVDFMTTDNSFLVDYELTRVGGGVEIYPSEAEWAHPSVEHAAALMRQVYDDPDGARRVGARAREDILRQLSPEATGAAMRRRLEHLAAGRRDRSRLARRIKRRLGVG